MARRIRQWIGFLIMLAGLGLLAGPFLLGAREEKVQKQVVDSFYQGVGKAQTVPTALPTVETQTPQEPQDPFYRGCWGRGRIFL